MIWWWVACAGPPGPSADVIVVYHARGQGEIEPCGCPERPVGGLARWNSALGAKRKEGPVVVVDAGATLGPNPEELDLRFLEQRHAKAELIGAALARGGIDGMALGAQDWALGTAFVRSLVERHRLPVLAANLVCTGGAPYPGGKVMEAGGRKIGLVGLTAGTIDGCTLTDPVAALEDAVAQLGPVDVVVGLVPYETDRSLAGYLQGDLPLDIVVDARGRAPAAGAERKAATWYAGAGAAMHGLSWMTLDFTAGARGWTTDGYPERMARDLDAVERRLKILDERIAAASPADAAILSAQADAYRGQAVDLRRQAAEVAAGGARHRLALFSLDLDDTVPDDPVTAAEVKAGKVAMEAAAGASGLHGFVPRMVEDTSSPWLGGEGCVGCHRAEHAQWSTTRHVRAWQALKESDRSMDQDCWACHVTGANLPGGPATPAATAGFHDVQCEACHGPGRAHAADPAIEMVADPERAVCEGCHDGKRDGGRFDWVSYRAKVVHRPAP